MLKHEFVAELSTQSGESKHAVENVLSALQEVVEQQVVGKGEKIVLQGLVTFTQKIKPRREVRNPKTGERFYADRKVCLGAKVCEKLK